MQNRQTSAGGDCKGQFEGQAKQGKCKAPVLCIAFAKKTFSMNGKENGWRQHDVGMANMALALQAGELGLSVHFMAGFDAAAAPASLGLDPEEYEAVCALAIGHRGTADQLPEELQDREQPSPRKPLAEVAVPARPA